jgi:trigger factor
MAVKTEQIEKNLSKLTFEVSAERFEQGMQKAYRKNVKKFNIPGFRKGKAPRAIVEKYYGKNVFYNDAIDDVLPEAYAEALKESELESVARPEIDIEEIKDGEPIVFTALVTTKPEVKLGEYKGVEIDKIEYPVTDEDVDNAVEDERKKNARMISVDDRAAENGDIVTIDFEGFVDGEPFDGGKGEEYDLEIGSGTFIQGFEEQVIGAKVGDDIEVKVTFPEEYHADTLAGKDAVFKVKVHEIKMRELPEADDDFASEVSEFDTINEYKKDIKAKLEKSAEHRAKHATEDAVIDAVVENSEVELPEAMVEGQIDRLVSDFAQRLSYQGVSVDMYLKYTGTTMEAFRAQFKQQAEKQLRGSLVLEAIGKAEGIEVGEEELELQIVDMAKQYNMETDKLKELLRPEDIDNIKNEKALAKTVEMLINHAVVKDA